MAEVHDTARSAHDRRRPAFTDRRIRVAALFVAGALVLGAGGAPASAATLIVNTKADTSDGACTPGAGGCTLREAIEAAVTSAGRDTIRFDPIAFPHEKYSNPIVLTRALPIIADPAGTVIDGAGASVRVDGNGAVEDGLVFASAPGVPLAKVTVANVSVVRFTRDAVEICGGVPPMCADDVSAPLVRNVFASTTGRSGIAIRGRVVKKPRVVDSVTFQTGTEGIVVFAQGGLVGARVQGCTAARAGSDGIIVTASPQNGTAIVDSLAAKIGADGIEIEVEGVGATKAKIANVATYQTGHNGIMIDGQDLFAPSISNAVASMSEATGIAIDALGATGPTLERVVADGNGLRGIQLLGPITGGEISRAYAFGNDTGVNVNNADGVAISDAIAADNTIGIDIGGGRNLLEGVHAGANALTGIRVSGDDGNTITQSAITANGGTLFPGIWIDASSANTVTANVALGNGLDLYDANLGCDANAWSANVFRTRGQSCIH